MTENYKFSIAHAFRNGLTCIANARNTSMHGEQVAFGIAVPMLLLLPIHPELPMI